MRRTSFSALVVLLALAVAGCGGEEKSEPLGPIGDGADTSSGEPSPEARWATPSSRSATSS